MSDFSDFIVYVDESGDHGPVSTEFPVFVLAFCIFRKEDYAAQVTTTMTRFKFRHFGHDALVLHEREIRKRKGKFALLMNPTLRGEFMSDLSSLIQDAPFSLVATVIDKARLAANYERPQNPYHLGLRFGLERVAREVGAGQLHVIFEARGTKEDNELELEFRRICAGENALSRALSITPVFAAKSATHCGLELADLVARPIGRRVLAPSQTEPRL